MQESIESKLEKYANLLTNIKTVATTVVAGLAILISGAFWFSGIQNSQTSLGKSIEKHEARIELLEKAKQDNEKLLIRLETKLDLLIDKLPTNQPK